MIRHVLLDADGVIQSTRDGWHLPLAAELGDDAEAFFDLLAADERPCLVGDGDFRTIAMERFISRGLADRFDELLGPFWTGIEVDIAVLRAVDQLRAEGYRVHLATNQERHRGTYMRSVLGYEARFDSVHCSYELASAKPDAAYFAKVLRRIRAQPEETVFVDDNHENVAVAESLGIRSYRWDRLSSAESFAEVLEALGAQVG